MRNFAVCLGLGLALQACSEDRKPAHEGQPNVPGHSTLFDETALNPKVDPCDDFYQFACGGWLKTYQLPADESSHSKQSSGLDDAAEKALGDELARLTALGSGTLNPMQAKLVAFYNSCMDTQANASTQSQVLDADFGSVANVQTSEQLAKEVARLQGIGAGALFGFGSWVSVLNSKMEGAGLSPGGFSLPNKDFYLSTDPDMVEIQAGFRKHVAKMFVIRGAAQADADAKAQVVWAIEKALAEKTLDRDQEANQPELQVNVTKVEDLLAKAPHFDWQTFFTATKTPGFVEINVSQPAALAALDALLAARPIADIKTYLEWRVLHAAAPATSGALEDEDFQFWQKTLNGQDQPQARWKTCTDAVEARLPDLASQLFIERYPDAEAIKARALKTIGAIENQFNKDLDTLTWLDDTTRTRAREKLGKVTGKVGYPDKFRTYDTLEVNKDSYLVSDRSGAAFDFTEDLARINQPTDRSRWQMGAWVANAYYEPTDNSINFPLGAMIPPIFDVQASDGLNLGSFGASWVGHELTHGFDANGRKFDGEGNLKDWWTDASAKNFNDRIACLIDQANKYELSQIPGLFVNGSATITENLADQGGMKIGWLAYRELADSRPPASPIAGYNEDQQFFIAYAQGWCEKRTDQSLKHLVLSNEHPPEEFRTNAVIMNEPGFEKVFSCKPGSRMAPVKRCSVW
jgi:predicted metalloendopeptidase